MAVMLNKVDQWFVDC